MDKKPESTDLIRVKYQAEEPLNPGLSTQRLDQFLAGNLKQFSRAQLQKLIEAQLVLVDGKAEKASYRLHNGQEITVLMLPPVASGLEAQAMPLNIVYEDEYLAVVNKPAGMVVHPGAGVHSGTLVHGLLHHMQGSLSGIGGVLRPGIVHRLDKDTSGLLVVAKADRIHQHLARQIQSKEAKRIYMAVLEGGLPSPAGLVNAPIGRHPGRRTEMAILKSGRAAQTLYSVLSCVESNQTSLGAQGKRLFSLVKLELKTGRTHQIRVHMASLNCPVFGDLVYNRKSAGTTAVRKKFGLNGQALHACGLSFVHPVSKQLLEFRTSLPQDWSHLMLTLFPAFDFDTFQL